MDKLSIISLQIQKLRTQMHELIDEKENNLAPEVINVSQILDEVLNQYYEEEKLNKYH